MDLLLMLSGPDHSDGVYNQHHEGVTGSIGFLPARLVLEVSPHRMVIGGPDHG